VSAFLLCTQASALAQAFERGRYEIVAETVMPHLEENLRYATSRERRCLAAHELSSIFPILRHDSLAGCRLADERRYAGSITYLLVCASREVASGKAWLDVSERRVLGTLEVKMGGKNMTFAQRIEALHQGECDLP
jgi:hypothetical protein